VGLQLVLQYFILPWNILMLMYITSELFLHSHEFFFRILQPSYLKPHHAIHLAAFPHLIDCFVLVTQSAWYILLRDNQKNIQDAPCKTSCPADQQLQSTNIWYYENVLSRINTLHIWLLLPLGQRITPHVSHLSTPNYVQSRFISDTIWHSYFCIVWQSDYVCSRGQELVLSDAK